MSPEPGSGVQLKFSAVMEASGGLTIPAGGMSGSWIVKLPSGRFTPVPENEYTMMALAGAVGIEVPRTELIEIREIRGLHQDAGAIESKALAAQRRRQDHPHGGFRAGVRTLSGRQVPPPRLCQYRRRAMGRDRRSSTYEFLRRLIFSVLIGNADMHLKNWPLLYPDRRAPVLSPAFDFVSTLPHIAHDQLALTFRDSRSLLEITTDQVRRFADTARLPTSPLWPIVIETTHRTVAAWEKLVEKDLLLEKMRTAIGDQIL